MQKVSRTAEPLGRRDARSRIPLCIQTSVDLADRSKWTCLQPGSFSAVRFNFVADVSHVKRPRAYSVLSEDVGTNGLKRRPSPLGQVDLAKTCKAIVADDVIERLHEVVRGKGGRRTHTYQQVNDAVRNVIVSSAPRSGAGLLAPSIVRRGGGDKIPRRRDVDNEVLLLGVREVTLYLAFVDYLVVTYKRRPIGRHLVRYKAPSFLQDTHARANELDMSGFPFLTFQMYEAHSFGDIPDDATRIDVDDLDKMVFADAPAACSTAIREVAGRIASLYQVANAAFPMNRDVAAQRTWTEETLAALPLGPHRHRIRARDVDWE
jgi:hypothetical protein